MVWRRQRTDHQPRPQSIPQTQAVAYESLRRTEMREKCTFRGYSECKMLYRLDWVQIGQ